VYERSSRAPWFERIGPATSRQPAAGRPAGIRCYTGAMSETVTLRVHGMTCGGCENAVKFTLMQLRGIEAVAASHSEKSVDVRYDSAEVTPDRIRRAIEELGYQVAA
jgi:copper chaperone